MGELCLEKIEVLLEEAETEVTSPSDEAAQHLEQAFALEDEFGKALEACDAAIQLEPTLTDAHNLRGVILEELGRAFERPSLATISLKRL